MELAYEYTRRRDDFGKPVDFRDGPTVVLESILPTDSFDDSYFLKKTVSTGVCTVPRFSETEVNTERVVTKNSSIQHVEGGWPKDVDFTEQVSSASCPSSFLFGPLSLPLNNRCRAERREAFQKEGRERRGKLLSFDLAIVWV